jgi:very-short-patch-repair endonuclease
MNLTASANSPSPFKGGVGVGVKHAIKTQVVNMQRLSPNTKTNARNLRKNMTDVERLLWSKIRGRQLRGFRFRRQHPIGRYIVDFVCIELKLIVEMDGGQHGDQQQYDMNRTQWLQTKGYKVIRFWNNDVIDDLEGVMQAIYNHLPPSQPSP